MQFRRATQFELSPIVLVAGMTWKVSGIAMSKYTLDGGLICGDSNLNFRADIRREWGRFSADEVAALENNRDHAFKLSRKYRLDQQQAEQVELILTPGSCERS